MNLSFIVGNLVKDPLKVETAHVCKMTVAVNENYTKEDGSRPVHYFNVAVWNKLADVCMKYLKKGSKVAIVGKMQNRSWEDADGVKHYAQEVVAQEIEFLSTPKANSEVPKDTTAVNDEILPF